MKTALITIHYPHIKRILEGSKTVELRKAWNDEVKQVYVYCAKGHGAPKDKAGKVVACFAVKSILRASPAEIWEQHAQDVGIIVDDFDDYYGKRKTGVAIRICNVEPLDMSLNQLILISGKRAKVPPQGYNFLKMCESCEMAVAKHFDAKSETHICDYCDRQDQSRDAMDYAAMMLHNHIVKDTVTGEVQTLKMPSFEILRDAIEDETASFDERAKAVLEHQDKKEIAQLLRDIDELNDDHSLPYLNNLKD